MQPHYFWTIDRLTGVDIIKYRALLYALFGLQRNNLPNPKFHGGAHDTVTNTWPLSPSDSVTVANLFMKRFMYIIRDTVTLSTIYIYIRFCL